MSGEIIEVNSALEDEPELVNGSPYDDGWLFSVKISSSEDFRDLLDAEGYQALVEEE